MTLMDFVWIIYFTVLIALFIKIILSIFESDKKIDKDEYMRNLKKKDV